MSNERIDLTQFEGTTEGPWNMDELGEIWRAVAPDAEPYCVMSFYHRPCITPSNADLRLMAAGPALIAELKTCYEAIDVLSKSTIDDAVINMRLAKTLAKQNRDIEEIIDCLDGVDSIFGEEIIGMLRPLLARF